MFTFEFRAEVNRLRKNLADAARLAKEAIGDKEIEKRVTKYDQAKLALDVFLHQSGWWDDGWVVKPWDHPAWKD